MDSNNGIKVFSLIFRIICLTACMYQVSIILHSYFNYHQGTKTDFDFPKNFRIRDLSQCYRYNDIIDKAKISSKYNLTKVQAESFHHYVTISDIFEFTPLEKFLILSCIIHHESYSILPQRMNQSECYKYFEIKKYFTMEYLCYRLHWKEDIILNFEVIGTALYYSSASFVLTINRTSFDDTDFIKPFLHNSKSPSESRFFAPTVVKGQTGNYSEYFILSFTKLNIKQLGRPYNDIICNPRGDISSCRKRCINTLLQQKYNKLSPEFLYEKPVSLKHMTEVEFNNESIIQYYNEIQEYCSRECRTSSCYTKYTMTYTDWFLKLNQNLQETVVRVAQPSGPFIHIDYYPKNEFYDVFIYVCSTLGSWLGVVLIRLDPFLYYGSLCQFFKKKKKKPKPDQRVNVRIKHQQRIYNHIQNHVNQTVIYDPLIANANVRLARLAEMTYRE